MKKEMLKGYVVGAVSTLLVAGTVVPVVAQNIDVMSGVKIYVDDYLLQGAEGFIYDSTTYLPVRKISEAIGKPVSWDGKTKSVYIGKHDSAEPALMLKDLDYSNRSKSGRFYQKDSIQDALGRTYYDAIKLDATYRNTWEEYRINGNYSHIKGKASLGYNARATKGISIFRIYGDDKLLYTSPEFTGGVEPIDFDVDISGVLILKIEYQGIEPDGIYLQDLYLLDTGLYQ